jgi:hypothetical protein
VHLRWPSRLGTASRAGCDHLAPAARRGSAGCHQADEPRTPAVTRLVLAARFDGVPDLAAHRGPVARAAAGRPSSCSTSHHLSASSRLIDSGGAAGSNLLRPRSQAQEPGNGSHSCAATGPGPSAGLAHFPDTGHPWPGQQWQSNPRGKAARPSSEPKSSPPTGPAGDAHATLEPRADQAPEFLT